MVDSSNLPSQSAKRRERAEKNARKKASKVSTTKSTAKLVNLSAQTSTDTSNVVSNSTRASKDSRKARNAKKPRTAKRTAESNQSTTATAKSNAEPSNSISTSMGSNKSVTEEKATEEEEEVLKCTCRPKKKKNRKDYYYLVLGLTRHAAPEHITLSYQMEINQLRILQAHQNGSLTQEQKDRLAEVNFAYSILGHAQRRKIYDTYGLRGVLLATKHPTLHHSLWMIATSAWRFAIHFLTYVTCFWCGCCCFCGCCCIFCCRCCCNGCCGHMNENIVCEVHHAQFEDYTVDGKTITRVKDGKKHGNSNSSENFTISSKYRGRRHSAPPATNKTPHKERARLFIDQPQYSVKHLHQFKPACDNDTADILKKYNAPEGQRCLPELDMKKRANSDSKIYVKGSNSKKSSESKNMEGSKKTSSGQRIRSIASLKVQSTMMSSQMQPAPNQKTGSSTVGTSSCTSSNCKDGKQSKHNKVEKKKKKEQSRKG